MGIHLQAIDHIALRVRNLETSALWYAEVLGLKRVQPTEWGDFPIFMVTENGSGIALFPSGDAPKKVPVGHWLIGDHYAFRVSQSEFKNAQDHLRSQEINFHFQDHIFFHSIYFNDPDGHQLEITAQVRELNQSLQ